MRALFLFCLGLFIISAKAQTPVRYYLSADRVFDGIVVHEGWVVLVENDRIVAVGPKDSVKKPEGSIVINKPNCTIIPGLIEGHSHLFLHPYDVTDWDIQVLKESDSYRTARATVHALNSLLAGFTTERDLGTEGAGYSDVGLKRAIVEGLIPGPRIFVSGRAIVATGSYGPKGYDDDMVIMKGAESADGPDLIRVVRDQIGHGIDWVKVYADYRWGPSDTPNPTFSQDELQSAVETAKSAGLPVAAHASTKEGMKRAILAGVETIEHGDFIDPEIEGLMIAHHTVYFPTLAASESIAKYKGWVKGKMEDPASVARRKKGFKEALQAGVIIGMGGDVGVFAHGENVLEMELMVEYGMSPLQALKAATTVNASALHQEKNLGAIRQGYLADLIIVAGNPATSISDLRKVKFVMKDGKVYKNEE
jgi:imidazolonepropionase-like amidohydrolase